MNTLTTAIEFVNDSTLLPSTGDSAIFICALLFIAISLVLFFLRKKHKLFFRASMLCLTCVLACGVFVFFNDNSATANKLTDAVPSKITAHVTSEVKIDDGYIQHSDDESILSFCGINVSSNEDVDNSSWSIKYDDTQIYSGKCGNTATFDSPFYIENSKHVISVNSDIDLNKAKELNGKNPVCLDFSVESVCRVSGSVTTATNSGFAGVSVQFVANDGWRSPIVLTDANGQYCVMAKQGTTGHIHFSGKAAAHDSEEFTVARHMQLDDIILEQIPNISVAAYNEYTGSQITGINIIDGASLDSGNISGTNIGNYTASLVPNTGFAWEDGSKEPKTFSWHIQGAYVKHSAGVMTFMYGTDYVEGDDLVLVAENANSKSEIPWMGVGGVTRATKVVFDSSMKNYPVSQTAWWFEGGVAIKSFEGLNNLNLVLDVNKHGMESMFNGCWSIESLDLSSLNTANSQSFCWMFYNCIKLKSLNLSNFNTVYANDLNHMFDGCFELTSLDLSSFNTKNVLDMSYMFGINNDDSKEERIKELTSKLETIIFGSNFDTSKVKDMNHMFYKCESIKELDLRSFNTSSVENFQNFIDSCKSLNKFNSDVAGTFDFSSFNFANATDLSWFASACESDNKVILNNATFTKSCSVWGMLAFNSNLAEVNCCGFDTVNIAWFGEMFKSDSALVTIYCDAGTKWVGDPGNTDIFKGCTKLKGGNDTSFNPLHTGLDYACEDIDGQPGYFTGVNLHNNDK